MADPTISSSAGGLFNTSDSTAASSTASISVTTGISDTVTGTGGLFKGQASDSIQQEFSDTLTEIENFSNQALNSATAAETAKTAAELAKQTAESIVNGLGLGSIGFSLSGISEGDLLYYNGANIAPLEQVEVTDGGNF